MSGRGAANLLTRITALFAAAFFVTSILLTLIARQGGGPGSGLDSFVLPDTPGQTGGSSGGSSPLEGLQLPTEKKPEGPQVPQSQ